MAFSLAKEKSTHNPMLIKTVLISGGPVLEIGAGIYSTPLLHWLCKLLGRNLVTYENNTEHCQYAKMFVSRHHSIKLIDDWSKIDTKTHWGVVFMDHNPDSRRADDVISFKDRADYIVIHDTDREDKYHMERAWPHFKYRYTWKDCRPWTTVVSNFKNLSSLDPVRSRQKLLWEKLAKSNSRYFIYTNFGRGITEEQFSESGIKDYQKHILNDPLIKTGETFLEIGCGIGRLLNYALNDTRFKKFIGIDISGEMIQQARKRMADRSNLRLIETDGYTIPLEDDSVDFAFSHLVFVHFKTIEMLKSNFMEVFRVLKPKGLFKVLVRIDNVNLEKWWGGVTFDEKILLDAGVIIIKKEVYDNWAQWLWLEKQ